MTPGDGDFERYKWEREFEIKREELALNERAQTRADDELRLRHEELTRSKRANPLNVALVTAGIVGIVNIVTLFANGYLQRAADLRRTDTERGTEIVGAEDARILEAIKATDLQTRVENLLFLVHMHLISNSELIANITPYANNNNANARNPRPGENGAPQTHAAPGIRQTLALTWLGSKGEILWPPGNGCASPSVSATLPVETMIDRFGSEYGSFFNPKGTDFATRSLPYVCRQLPYAAYRVIKPLPVTSCHVAPWFDEPGGATQFETDEPAAKLQADGFIEPIGVDARTAGQAAAPCPNS